MRTFPNRCPKYNIAIESLSTAFCRRIATGGQGHQRTALLVQDYRDVLTLFVNDGNDKIGDSLKSMERLTSSAHAHFPPYRYVRKSLYLFVSATFYLSLSAYDYNRGIEDVGTSKPHYHRVSLQSCFIAIEPDCSFFSFRAYHPINCGAAKMELETAKSLSLRNTLYERFSSKELLHKLA